MYWNCNGMGSDWDGRTCRKLQQLQQSGPCEAILLVETHLKLMPVGPEWVASAPVAPGDRSAGALIWLGPRLRNAMIDSGHTGSRLAWVRIRTDAKTPLLLVAHYIAHFQRTRPSRDDCFDTMEYFLSRIYKQGERILYCTDANSRIRRGIPGVTGRYSMYSHNCHGGDRLQSACEAHGLYVISTQFNPRNQKKRIGSATFRPRDQSRPLSQIDYIMVAKRYMADIRGCHTRWDNSIRFTHRYDHARIVIKMRIKLRAPTPRREPEPDMRLLRDSSPLREQFDAVLSRKLSAKRAFSDVSLPPPALNAKRQSIHPPELQRATVRTLLQEYAQLTEKTWREVVGGVSRQIRLRFLEQTLEMPPSALPRQMLLS